MRPDTAIRLRRWLFLALALVAALAAARILPTLNVPSHPRFPSLPSRLPPPLAIVITASGPIRAIAINVLWVRATRLQDEGKYFELNDLCSLITSLEPRLRSDGDS